MFLDEIAARFESASLATRAVDLFLSSRPVIPAKGNGPFTSLAETGGTGPMSTHGEAAGYHQSGGQCVVRASSYEVARQKAQAEWDELATIRNETLSGTFYLWVTMMQEPFDMASDEAGRSKVGFNFLAMRRAP